MRLRNKRTEKIFVGHKEPVELFYSLDEGDELIRRSYTSISALNEEWEDYEPKEPLIKDEKVRKAIRAWAEANKIDQKHYYDTKVEFDYHEHRLKWIGTSIEFNNITGLETLDDGEKYTIAELCGEEEE